jgi:uncharacterized protein DUF6953
MWARFRQHDELDQEDAAYGIEEKFGAGFVYLNDNGNPAIDRRVLTEFRKLSGDGVVWSRSERMWRLRDPYDDPSTRLVD